MLLEHSFIHNVAIYFALPFIGMTINVRYIISDAFLKSSSNLLYIISITELAAKV